MSLSAHAPPDDPEHHHAERNRQHDETGLDQLYELWDENPDIARNRAFLARAKEHGETLKEMMAADRLQLHDRTERGWTPPPKGYTKGLDA